MHVELHYKVQKRVKKWSADVMRSNVEGDGFLEDYILVRDIRVLLVLRGIQISLDEAGVPLDFGPIRAE